MECVTGRILKNVGAPENIHGMEQLHKHDQVLHLGAGWAGERLPPHPLLPPEAAPIPSAPSPACPSTLHLPPLLHCTCTLPLTHPLSPPPTHPPPFPPPSPPPPTHTCSTTCASSTPTSSRAPRRHRQRCGVVGAVKVCGVAGRAQWQRCAVMRCAARGLGVVAGDAVLPLLRPELPPHRLAAGCSPPVPPALPAAAEGQVRPGGCPQKGACRQEARRQEGSAAAGGARG